MAAQYDDYELIPGRTPKQYYDEIKDLLLDAHSVEVIRHSGDKLFFRAWFGKRSDGSMAVNPTNDEY